MLGPPVRIIVAEEITLVREGLVRLCQSVPNCSVVGQCGDGQAALSLIQRLKPDIALLDLNLPDLHVFEVLASIRRLGLETRAIVLSNRRDRKAALECMRAGATGYIVKSGPVDDLQQAIEQSPSGAIFISGLVDMDGGAGKTDHQRDVIETLSAREHQVFLLLIEGVRPKDIAARLDVSPKTVDTYRASLMRKLDIHDVAGLVKFAIHRELTSLGQ